MMKPATALPWEWWTSNSMMRLGSSVTHKDGDVLSAYKASDGVACVSVSNQNAAYIAHACNAYPRLVEALKRCVYSALPENVSKAVRAADAQAHTILRELGEEA